MFGRVCIENPTLYLTKASETGPSHTTGREHEIWLNLVSKEELDRSQAVDYFLGYERPALRSLVFLLSSMTYNRPALSPGSSAAWKLVRKFSVKSCPLR